MNESTVGALLSNCFAILLVQHFSQTRSSTYSILYERYLYIRTGFTNPPQACIISNTTKKLIKPSDVRALSFRRGSSIFLCFLNRIHINWLIPHKAPFHYVESVEMNAI